MADTDKIKAGIQERGMVMIPKWLIVAITGFVFALLATAVWKLNDAGNELAIMNERQSLNTDRLKKVEEALSTAAHDRYTGTQGAEAERRIREMEREVDALTLRVVALEKK